MSRIRRTFFVVLLGTVSLVAVPTQEAHAINIWIIIKKAVIKVIKAVDLMIQRMQNETIALQNAAKVLENKLSQLKLDEIADWTERQRQLYKEYYDELWRVRNTIAMYKRIQKIVERQVRIVDEYKFVWQTLRNDDHFTRSEIDYMYRVYTGMLNESVQNIDQLLLVINSFKMQMSDAKRLELIDAAAEHVEQNYADLKQFSNQNIQLSLNRAKDEHELESVRKLYGVE